MIFVDNNENLVHVILEEAEVLFCRNLGLQRKKYKIWRKEGKDNAYPDGLLNDENDEYQTERLGAYGEKVLSALTGLSINEEVLENGDPGWDFITLSKDSFKIDSKVAKTDEYNTSNKYGELYIRATDDHGREKELKSDYYFFATIIYHDGTTISKGYRTERNATTITLDCHGFISKEDILKNKEERLGDCLYKGGNWKNFYVKKSELIHPITFIEQNRDHFDFKEMDLFI